MYEEKYQIWGAKQAQIDALEVKSKRKAMAVCLTGSSIVIAQFGIIAFGTFEYLSWDIMEPVSYLMMFSNFSFGYLFYLRMKKDLVLTNFFDILSLRFTEKACRRAGIDLKKHKEMEEEINQLRKLLDDLQI